MIPVYNFGEKHAKHAVFTQRLFLQRNLLKLNTNKTNELDVDVNVFKYRCCCKEATHS